jgi:hypothetical protein
MLYGTHGSGVFPYYEVFTSYNEIPRFSNHTQRGAKLDKNGQNDVADNTSRDNIRYFTSDTPTIKMLIPTRYSTATNMEG